MKNSTTSTPGPRGWPKAIQPRLRSWISERRKSHQLDRRSHEQSHFQQAGALLRRDLNLRDDRGATGSERGQRLTLTGHS